MALRASNPFLYYIRKAKQRNKGFDIDTEYLQTLWEETEGKCCYTGLPMKLFTSKGNNLFTMASLDRIDSSQGYLKGNVQFCLLPLNLAKSNADNEEFKSFLEMIRTK